ncbi:MAG TPA: hypothetical protein VE010_00870, partial [Thermoanaerobaculia bacterium]|nr:hypothetical protein [Thermoanaerobaculia bacterium]
GTMLDPAASGIDLPVPSGTPSRLMLHLGGVTFKRTPMNRGVTPNTAVTLAVEIVANPGVAYSYQWYTGPAGNLAQSTAIQGATGPSYAFTATQTQQYWVRVSANSCAPKGPQPVNGVRQGTAIPVPAEAAFAYADSPGAIVTVTPACPSPHTSVLAQPLSGIINKTQDVLLTAFAEDPLVTRFDWYVGASGDTSQMYAASQRAIGVYPTTTTTYWVRGTTACGSHDSAPITVYPCLPVIDVQPAAQSYVSGGTTNLTVTASVLQTDAPLTFIWYRSDNVEMKRETVTNRTSSYAAPAGTYYVIVQGACHAAASIRSSNAVVTTCTPPSIAQQPNHYSQYKGYSAGLSVYANGSNLTYQWYRGQSGNTSSPVNGQTTSQLTINSAQETTYYWVRISGPCGSVDSNAVTISVYPQFYVQPQPQDVPYGDPVELWVSTMGTYLSYQWYENGVPVGTNSPTLLIPSVTEQKEYMCVVTSGVAASYTNTVLITPY